MPKKIEFAHNVLESIAGVLSRNSDALKVVMIPALNFKRAIAKGDRNDPVADGYLNMLAMLSLQLTGMKPIKLIVDLAKELFGFVEVKTPDVYFGPPYIEYIQMFGPFIDEHGKANIDLKKFQAVQDKAENISISSDLSR
ncbi:hypothetical protein DERP_015416 [Dermatophagoides pteronyssinus]|uniref:Uncharacterized protein n=1 Tax=Dermatophagoides pteronyssinus TaxID=6956 RepID=A0ABQ8J1F3_DERPT|nr:hypothetical protein DERP_015416 [Dermatophagoides pteronyssinus]